MGATAGAGGFTGWMVGASQAVTGATVAGLNVGAVMKPFAAVGSAIGTGVSAVTGINLAPASTATAAQTAAAGVNLPSTLPAATPGSYATSTGMVNTATGTSFTLPGASTAAGGATVGTGVAGVPGITVGSAGSGTLASNVTAGMSAAQTATVTANTTAAIAPPVKTASWFARHPKLTEAGVFVGKQVAGAAISGAVGQYIAGDPEQQGSMSGAAYEGGEYLDPLKVYAAQQGINTDGIYQHMMYGNQDPSTQYGSELFRQQTFGVA
jgi:hypothetical protein